jgi:4-hydroxy 2-oxovalerate aldolase
MDLIDVTLRDGGHVVNFNWPIDFAKEYYQLMCTLPEIKFIELGYWKQSSKSNNPFYNLNYEMVKEIVGNQDNNNVSIMIDYHYCLKNLDEYPTNNQNIISMIRLCVRKEDMEEGLEFGKKLKEHTGLNVSLNIFNISNYTSEELIILSTEVVKYPFDYVYFADTHGSLEFPKDSIIFNESIKLLKSSGKKIGMHLHDHSGNALWNFRHLSDLGFEFSDTSVRGMGKGSGNLKLEFVVNKKNIVDVADLIQKYTTTLRLEPTPYELITAYYGLTDNYAKEANNMNMNIKDFENICKKISGVDKDTYNKSIFK